MQRKMLTLLAVPLLAIALAASAVAFVPGILNAFSAGPSTATSFAAPSWKVGDTWTYNVSLGSMDAQVLPSEMLVGTSMTNESLVAGTLTETVVGSVSTPYGQAWNTTVDATLALGEPQPEIGTQPMLDTLSVHAVTLTGFVWYRASDLAPVYAVRTVHLGSTWTLSSGTWTDLGMLANATYSLNYTATTAISFAPPLETYAFPLQQNETWNATSNATVRYASTFDFSGPNVTFETSHAVNFTVPLHLTMRTGMFENVTTPAGTFRALPVTTSRGEFGPVADRDASAMLNLTESMDVEVPHAFALAWFSGQVGNVVRADIGIGAFEGPRVELDLVSYSTT